MPAYTLSTHAVCNGCLAGYVCGVYAVCMSCHVAHGSMPTIQEKG